MAACGFFNNDADFEIKNTEEMPSWLPTEKLIVVTVGGSTSKDGKRLAQIILDYKTSKGKQLAFFGKPTGESVPTKNYPLLLGERITEVLSYRSEKSGPLGVGATFTTSAGRTFTLNEQGMKVLGPNALSTKRSKGWMLTGLKRDKEAGGIVGVFVNENQATKTLRKKMKDLGSSLPDMKARKAPREEDPSALPKSQVGLINFGDRRKSTRHQVRGSFSPWFHRKLDGHTVGAEDLGPHGDAQFEPSVKSPKPLRKGSAGSSNGVYKPVEPVRRPQSPQPRQPSDGQEQLPEMNEKGESRQWFGKYSNYSTARRG